MINENELLQNNIEKVGEFGMRLIKDRNGNEVAVCKTCQEGSHKEFFGRGVGPYTHDLEEDYIKRNRGDCKNTDTIDGHQHQCQCGFFGIYKNSKWQDWEQLNHE